MAKMLALDVGNTNLVVGLYDHDHLLQSFRLFTDRTRTVDEYGVLLSSHELDADLDRAPPLPIRCDPMRTGQVVRNLLSNAIKYTPENGRIKIKVRLLTQRAEISVIDTGVGIAPEHIANLFRIDKQVSTLGTKNEKGTGLGLILCKEFVDKHKGIIKVSSERKNGTEFKVFLPLEQQKQGANVERNQPQKFVEAG